jgi:Tfp pilus assembly protein PilF
MSTLSILFLLGSAIMAYIAVQTLKQTDMKIASDVANPDNIAKQEILAEEMQFEKIMDRVDHAFSEERLHDAESALETALNLRPDSEEVLGKMAFVLELQGDIKAATAIYDRALEIHQNSPELYAAYGSLLKKDGQLELAKEKYINAVQMETANALIYYNFSNLLAELGEIDAAKEGYQHALELDSNFKEAREALSALSMKKLDV